MIANETSAKREEQISKKFRFQIPEQNARATVARAAGENEFRDVEESKPKSSVIQYAPDFPQDRPADQNQKGNNFAFAMKTNSQSALGGIDRGPLPKFFYLSESDQS